MTVAARFFVFVSFALVLALVFAIVVSCSLPHPCTQPVFSSLPGHAHPPIEIVCS